MDYKTSIKEYLSKDINTFQKLDLEEINPCHAGHL